MTTEEKLTKLIQQHNDLVRQFNGLEQRVERLERFTERRADRIERYLLDHVAAAAWCPECAQDHLPPACRELNVQEQQLIDKLMKKDETKQ